MAEGNEVRSKLSLDVEDARAKLEDIDDRQETQDALILKASDRLVRLASERDKSNALIDALETRIGRLSKAVARIGLATITTEALATAGLESSFFGRLTGNVLTGAAFNPLNPATGAGIAAIATIINELLRAFRELLKASDTLREEQDKLRQQFIEAERKRVTELQRIEAEGRQRALQIELQAIPGRSEIIYQAQRALARKRRAG